MAWWCILLLLLHAVTRGTTRTLPLSSKSSINPSQNTLSTETKGHTMSSKQPAQSNTLTLETVTIEIEGNKMTSEQLPASTISSTNLSLGSVAIETETTASSEQLPTSTDLKLNSISMETQGNTMTSQQLPASTISSMNLSLGSVAIETETTASSEQLPTSTNLKLNSISMETQDNTMTSEQLPASTISSTNLSLGSVAMETKTTMSSEQLPTSTLNYTETTAAIPKDVDLFMRRNFNSPFDPTDYGDIFLPPDASHKVFDSPNLNTNCQEGFVRINNICRRVVQQT